MKLEQLLQKFGTLPRILCFFFSITRSLEVTLREQDVRSIVKRDGADFHQICCLEDPPRNYRDVLTDLIVKHEQLEQKGTLIGFRKLRWTIFTKREVRSMRLCFKNMKFIQSIASNAVTMYVHDM